MNKYIPKTIHFCWFGKKPLPPLAKKCILSWRKYCPDYKIVKWNENNFDINCCDYVREAYDAQKWAFVSDFARLYIIYKYGGIYLDTDVELIAPLDKMINNSFFFGVEYDLLTKKAYVNTGLGFGAIKKNIIIKAMLDEYEKLSFMILDEYDMTPCPVRNSHALERFGFDYRNKKYSFMGGSVYPNDFFCPKLYSFPETFFTDNTVSIHHFSNSWGEPKERYKNFLLVRFRSFLPELFSYQLAAYFSEIRYNGLYNGTKNRIKDILDYLNHKLILSKTLL